MNIKKLKNAILSDFFIPASFIVGCFNIFAAVFPFIIGNLYEYFYIMSLINFVVAFFMLCRSYALLKIALKLQEID